MSTSGPDLLAGYMQHLTRRHRSFNTIRLRLHYIRSFNTICWDLAAAEHDHFERWLRQQRGLWSDATAYTAVASVKAFYRWALKAGHISHDPTLDLATPIVYDKPQPIANPDSIRQVLPGANPTETAILLLGAECGLRVHEIAKLDSRDRDGEWLYVIGKGRKQRQVKMSPELCAALDSIETTTMRHTYYFPGKSGFPVHPSTIWRAVHRLIGVNPHALRHLAATTVWERTGDLRLAQEFLGHSRPETTSKYVRVARTHLARAEAATRLAA